MVPLGNRYARFESPGRRKRGSIIPLTPCGRVNPKRTLETMQIVRGGHTLATTSMTPRSVYGGDNEPLASVAPHVHCFGIMPATAQQITGTPGAPSATTTIDGNYIPNPPPAFGGEINLNAKDSKTWWPPNIVPPKGAPNILLIMTDDQGYGISGTFGGVIPTPTMDRIAQMGLRY